MKHTKKLLKEWWGKFTTEDATELFSALTLLIVVPMAESMGQLSTFTAWAIVVPLFLWILVKKRK
jgi:hypothetical protein